MQHNRFFKTIIKLSAGRSAYDPVFRRTLHVATLRKNKEKLDFLHERIKQLSEEIFEANKVITNKERLQAIKEELVFLKTKIHLLKL